MAIKLADVLSNVNSAYPVINAHEQTIVGFYNGASSSAATPIQIYYSSSEKLHLSQDGTTNNLLFATRLPYSNVTSSGSIASDFAYKLLSDKGGIITVEDEKLNDGSGGVAAYIAQVVNTGVNADSGRTSMARWTELIQDFDMYESIDSTGITSILDASGDEFYLAGFDTANNKTRKIKWEDVIGAIGGALVQELVNTGLITNSQGGDSGSGTVGDLNGDGNVSTADLLILLGGLGTGGTGSFSTARTIMSGTSETSASFEVTALGDTGSGTSGTFLLSDLTTFDYPSSYTLSGTVYGFNAETYSTNAANVYKLQECAVNDNNNLVWANRYLHVTMNTSVNFSGPDTLWALMHVKIIDGSVSSNELECVYYMSPGGFAPDQGLVTNNGTGGGFPIGVTATNTWFASTDPVDINSNLVAVADNYQDHADSLAGGFNMAFDGGTLADYIDDIEVRIYFHSLNGNVTVTVQDVLFEVKS